MTSSQGIARSMQEMILRLHQFWASQGCAIVQPYDMQVGAGTFHPATFLRSLGPEHWRAAYAQACRRPADGRYGDNPNRLQHYYQYQVVLKPSPDSIVDVFVQSLTSLGIDSRRHDIRMVEDNWESPTLGAGGLGWEVWIDGMEISQLTYFQKVAGFDCDPVTGELTYGLERIAMYLQDVDSVYDLVWSEQPKLSYGDLFLQNERDQSVYNFELADIATLQQQFAYAKQDCLRLCQHAVPLAAYDQCINASYYFNLLDARGALSVTTRQSYILEVRQLTRAVAQAYVQQREQLGFPLAPEGRKKHG